MDADARPADDVLAQLRAEAEELRRLLLETHQRLDVVAAALDGAAKQTALVPAQIRGLAQKVDGLTVSVAAPRLRALLLGLLSIYDLADQMLRTAGDDGVHRRNYETLRTQLRQLLADHGLEEVAADGTFDPQQHRAVETVACSDPAGANRIVGVVRAGFRSGGAVLRYAEVVVGQYQPPPEPLAA
jgi:molecular chaperone GrpE